ncbi:MAG: arginine repressor [Oscillospiraceae bacterium]|jgi:transcriptional regulator of arginine metabolism|nr:arginine repressor [Oscillospiraceae bacterium]
MNSINRRDAILRLIATRAITTQEELRQALLDEGHDVAQATVSRDIRELALIKTVGQNGQYCYAVATGEDTDELLSRQSEIFKLAVIGADCAGNTLAVKTMQGMASAACAAFDSMRWEGNVATLAGEDTFFVLCRNEGFASQMRDAILRSVR